MPDTSKLEKLNRELEKSEKKLRKAINDEKALQHQLKQLTRKERTHRLCTRGGMLESFLQEPERLTDDDVMDKMKGLLLQDKLVEYAYRQLSGEKAPTFHKLLFVYAEDTSAEVLRAAMLQKGFDLILVSSIWEAKRRIFEDKEIELILCDLELPDGTAMELFHTLRRVTGMFQMKNPPVRLLPFFILTENNDPATEYEYRHEGVNDYITAPVNIPELIRQVLFFVE